MNILFHMTELFATFIECILVLILTTNMSDYKYKRQKNTALVFIAAILYTVIITLLNQWQTFSFVTMTVAIVYTFIVNYLILKGSFINKAALNMVAWFFSTAMDYLVSYSLLMIIGNSINLSKGIDLILSPGKTRVIYLISDKFIQLAIFMCLKKIYPGFKKIKEKNKFYLMLTAFFSFIVMSIITSLILSDSVIVLQSAVIFSLIFIVLSIVVTIITISINSKYESEKTESQLIRLSYNMLEKNIEEYKQSQSMILKQTHDFKNHLIALSGIIKDTEKAEKYISDLIAESQSQAKRCASGNNIIDSIINFKKHQAEIKGISFEFKVNCQPDISISSTDICAILANQIDNAVEASEKIDSDKRFILVEIQQKKSSYFL